MSNYNCFAFQLLCLIGEAFDHSDQICGAVINIRGKSNKICKFSRTPNFSGIPLFND